MSEPTNTKSDPKIQSIQRLYAAVLRGDAPGILAELDDDVDWAAEAASTSAPWYGNRRGKAEVERFFKEIASTVEIEDFTPLTYASGETDVIVPVRFAFTVHATGKRAAMTMQHWWRFADGMVVFFRGAEDSEQTAAAFS